VKFFKNRMEQTAVNRLEGADGVSRGFRLTMYWYPLRYKNLIRILQNSLF
jgi:hypothetical protein